MTAPMLPDVDDTRNRSWIGSDTFELKQTLPMATDIGDEHWDESDRTNDEGGGDDRADDARCC